jgi:membrane protein implicated in regulation of membrane protease activity
MTTIGIILTVIFLDGWLRVGVIAALLVFEAIEIYIWLRWRKKRSITGAETVIGEQALVVTECRPSGQVKFRGQVWSATCPRGAGVGEAVVIRRVDGVKLEVEPAAGEHPQHPPPQSPGWDTTSR